MTDYELTLMNEAANDLYRAIKTISAIDHNLGYISSVHYPVIQSCKDILQSVAEDLYAKSVGESHD